MEEEISLRELIETLLKWKWIIVGITAAAVLFAGIFSLIQAEEYRTDARVKINPPITIEIPRLLALMRPDTQISFSDKSPYEYLTRESEITAEILEEEIESDDYLRLVSESEGIERDIDELAGMISLHNDDESEYVTIRVEGSDPEEVKNIADAAVSSLSEHVTTITLESLSSARESLNTQLERMEEELEGAEATVSVEGLDEFSNYAGDVESLRDISRHTSVEEVYAALVRSIEIIQVLEGLATDAEPLTVVSFADTPSSPDTPRTALNMAVAGVLGLMVGVFVSFFWEYWTSTSSGRRDPDAENNGKEAEGKKEV